MRRFKPKLNLVVMRSPYMREPHGNGGTLRLSAAAYDFVLAG